jgi:hypothetical protein
LEGAAPPELDGAVVPPTLFPDVVTPVEERAGPAGTAKPWALTSALVTAIAVATAHKAIKLFVIFMLRYPQ